MPPLQPRAPPLQPAPRLCSPRAAPATPRAAPAAPHAASAAPRIAPAARAPLACGPLTTLAARKPPACGPHAAPAARAPPLQLARRPLAARPPPLQPARHLVSASSLVAPPCSCRLMSHQTLLWHHRLGHPSPPRLRGMHSRLLVSGLPRSLPPLPPSPAPPFLPCVEGRQRAAPHSSSFPPTTAPLQTLHMDVWGPAHVSGHDRERYFLLVVDDYMRYTTVFPLRSKGEVPDVLIPWIRTVRLQLRERFGTDLFVLRLHSERGGEFSSDLLRDFVVGRAFSSCSRFRNPLSKMGLLSAALA
ncbi:unnamed protein product [Closterium sp. NIES-54]